QTPEGDDTHGLQSAPGSGESTPTSGTGGVGFDQIDAHLAAQLKRLGKQDSKTKMRALSEIQAYVEATTSWEDGLQPLLLAWPPLFGRHVFDTDRRVRAAVTAIHAALVVKCGKRLASQLKMLIGPWTAAFFDVHRETARNARLAFDAVFPESKRTEVYSYCVAELVQYATDCIVEQTPESLSDPRFADAEEMRAKHEHVVGAAFGILALVVEEVPAAKLRDRSTDFDALFSETNNSNQQQPALRFVSSPSSFVRRSVYRLIRTIMIKQPGLVQNSYRPLSRALLSKCFSDNDPNAHRDMWDAVLMLTKSYPQAWADSATTSANAEKKGSSSSKDSRKGSLVDKLFEFLRLRCRLSPTVSYPSILALLANLPAEVLDEPSFQPSFHKALWQGVTGQAQSNDNALLSLEPVADEINSNANVFSRSSYQESVALVTTISECFSFLWTRKLKESSDPDTCAMVGKEVAKEVDRLWHFYLQYPQFAQEMAVPIVKLYKKIELLAEKYDAPMLERVWAQASWFALKRLSGDSIYPIVYLVAQIAHLDPKTHKELCGHANKLLVAFCQLGAQSQDTQTAQSLIHVLAQLAPEIMFQDQFASKLEARLKSTGSAEDSVALVLSRAQHMAKSSGSVAEAVSVVNKFIAESISKADADGAGNGYSAVATLLAALPNSTVAKDSNWTQLAQLKALDIALTRYRPVVPDADNVSELVGRGENENDKQPVSKTVVDFTRMACQALLMYFSGTGIISVAAVDGAFSWMEQVFALVYGSKWSERHEDDGNGNGDSTEEIQGKWLDATREVLTSWTVLARDPAAGPRFVRYWLQRSGSIDDSALGLLFDTAISLGDKSTAATGIQAKLHAQVQQAWAATEAQLERLRLGHELAAALGESITRSVDDLDSRKDPKHLARLASAVYTRICPQDNASALRLLVSGWLLDIDKWHATLRADSEIRPSSAVSDMAVYLAATANACGSGLRQAVEDYAAPSHAKSFHTLAHWMATTPAVERAGLLVEEANNGGRARRFDAFGLSRFARRAVFSIGYLKSIGGLLPVFEMDNDVSPTLLAELVLNLTMAYVLLRESLLLAANYSGATETSLEGGDVAVHALGYSGPSIVRIDGEDSAALARASEAADAIQECVSTLLEEYVVGDSLSAADRGKEDVKRLHDPSHWLAVLMDYATSSSKTDAHGEKETLWELVARECVGRCRRTPASPWPLVLGALAQWCHWASPLAAGDLEAVVGGPLSRRLSQTAEDPAELVVLTAIVRAVSLRQQGGSQSPGMQSALLDLAGRLSRAVGQQDSLGADLVRLVAQLELAAELLPIDSASLDAGASTPKMFQVVLAAGRIASGRETDGTAMTMASKVAVALATLAVIERLTQCVKSIGDEDAVALGRLCLEWCSLDISDATQQLRTTSAATAAAAADAVLVAGARTVCGLAQMAECMGDESNRAIGPTMRQLATELVARCVLSERPVADGARAVAQLVRLGFCDAPPAVDALYPVLASASPRLAVELVQLVLAATDLGAHVGPHIDAVVRLVRASSKALADLAVRADELPDAVRSDEYVRNAAVRQLAAMVLLVRGAEALAATDVQRFDELAELVGSSQALDVAMPWVCALLGLHGDDAGGGWTSIPRLYDTAIDIDWDSLAEELVRNPDHAHALEIVACYVMHRAAWALPATLRSWWAGLPQSARATSVAVERFVTRHVSPIVMSREVERIRRQTGEEQQQNGVGMLAQTLEEYDDAAVRVGAAQATLLYTVDDNTLEMAVRLPPSYPLAPPTVESVKRVAVSEKRWRAWLVATQALLARNRHIDAACSQLVGNVGAHFAGVEDCAICYSAVGTIDNSLPSKQCRTCKNKFHRMCLFKWFNTSSQSTCPLCRNLF
ncbi:hypothetical protein EV177_006178, partial [Coemansia sp. RSA 1804]